MATSFPLGKGYTAAQWETWFQAFVTANPKMPEYTGTNAAAKGKTWDQVYAVLYATGQKAKPPDTPDQVAEATIVLAETQGFADGIGAVVTDVGNLPKISAISATEGATEAANSIPGVSQAAALENLLSFVTSKGGWERVAKIVVGSVMIIVGLVKITGADKAAATAAKGALL